MKILIKTFFTITKYVTTIGLFLNCIHLNADVIKLAVGLALPPYIIKHQNKGMELEIVQEALSQQGHSIELVYLPFIRVKSEIEERSVDAAVTINESSGITGVSYSNSHITYQNVAIALQERELSLNNVSDLTSYSVMAFQDASKYLGGEYYEMSTNNKQYLEKSQQSTQIKMLHSGRAEIVVMDINIYRYFKEREKIIDVTQPISIYELFPPTEYKVAFLSKKIRDDFNIGLDEIKSNGRYKEIITHYTKNFKVLNTDI